MSCLAAEIKIKTVSYEHLFSFVVIVTGGF